MADEKSLIAKYRAAVDNIDAIGYTATGSTGNRSYRYTTLDAVLKTVKDACTKQGITMYQRVHPVETQLFVSTYVADDDGEMLVGDFPIPQGKPQDMGSAETYARRYSLYAAFDLYPGEDDDGKAGQSLGGINETQAAQLQLAYHQAGSDLKKAMEELLTHPVQRLRELTQTDYQTLMRAVGR